MNDPNSQIVECPNCLAQVLMDVDFGQIAGFCPKCGDTIEMQAEA
jgi:ribosomal protein S27AE